MNEEPVTNQPPTAAAGGAWTETLCQATLDSLSVHIAVLDDQGTISYVNHAWREFAEANNDPTLARSDVGVNCFEVCRAAAESGDDDARRALEGMQQVLEGALPHFEMEYPCDDPVTGEERWFTLRVTPLRHNGLRGVVTSHTNITRLKHMEALFAREQVNRDRSERQASELGSLDTLYRSPGTMLTAVSYGMEPISRSHPDAFAGLVVRYEAVLELAMEERAYKVVHGIEPKLREIVQDLAFLKAGPRDVVEIHGAALRRRAADCSPQRLQSVLEEGRIMVLEAMGYLVSRYRNEALGMLGQVKMEGRN